MPKGIYKRKKGKPLSEETKREISNTLLGHSVSKKTRKKIGEASKKIWSNPEYKQKMKLSHVHLTGKNNPNWKGGRLKAYDAIRNSDVNQQWKQNVYIRDNFTCQKCGDNKGGNLVAHHIKPFVLLLNEAKTYLPLYDLYTAVMLYKPLWDLDNGIILCEKCHKIKHKKRKYIKHCS